MSEDEGPSKPDLVTFLKSRLDEDEAAAKAAAVGGRWRYYNDDSVGAWTLYDEEWEIASLTTYRHTDYDYAARMPAFRHPGYVDADANGAHIARHDPARVLREVEAKRRILGDHNRVNNGRTCMRCRNWDDRGDMAYPCETVRLLALPYATHPDYQQEWKP